MPGPTPPKPVVAEAVHPQPELAVAVAEPLQPVVQAREAAVAALPRPALRALQPELAPRPVLEPLQSGSLPLLAQAAAEESRRARGRTQACAPD